jgi:hypothetical protein
MAKVRLKDLTDEEVLLALLQNPSKLDKFESKVFEEWSVIAGRGGKLSDKQVAMARRKFEVLGLIEQFDRENLASTNKVTGAKIHIKAKEDLDELMGPKIVAPPRKSRWPGGDP